MGISFNTTIVQATGVMVYYRTPSNSIKKPAPVIRSFYAGSVDVVAVRKETMEELCKTQ